MGCRSGGQGGAIRNRHLLRKGERTASELGFCGLQGRQQRVKETAELRSWLSQRMQEITRVVLTWMRSSMTVYRSLRYSVGSNLLKAAWSTEGVTGL